LIDERVPYDKLVVLPDGRVGPDMEALERQYLRMVERGDLGAQEARDILDAVRRRFGL
jgi:hypothetical protein